MQTKRMNFGTQVQGRGFWGPLKTANKPNRKSYIVNKQKNIVSGLINYRENQRNRFF